MDNTVSLTAIWALSIILVVVIISFNVTITHVSHHACRFQSEESAR